MYGATLRQARAASGLTQAQLAVICGVGRSNISAIENDRRKPAIDTLQRLLAGCGHALFAVGSSGRIALPHPDEPDDVLVVPSRPDPRLRPATPEEANRALMAVLAVSEAIIRATATPDGP